MPRNGSGTYAPPAGQPVVGGTTIDSAVFNALVADLGTEFTRSVSTDGQSPMAANLPMGGNKITGLAAGTLSTDAARVDQLGGPASTLRTDLAAANGGTLVGTQQPEAGSVPRTQEDVNAQMKHVRDFGGTWDGVANDAAAWQLAANSGVRTIDCRGVVSAITTQVNLASNQTWLMNGAKITTSGTTLKTFSAVSLDRLNMIGPWQIVGDVSGDPGLAVTSVGLYIEDCSRFGIMGLFVSKIKGWGIRLANGAGAVARANHGYVADCRIEDCEWGWKDEPGCEYVQVRGLHVSGCFDAGIDSAAGNVTFDGGRCMDNLRDGFRLNGGSNHAHGTVCGMEINHNVRYNLYASLVTNGQTFIGCHFYGSGTSTGAIFLDRCKGIVIEGGHLDCWIYNYQAVGSGYNYVLNMYCPGGYGDIERLDAGSNVPSELILLGCTGAGAYKSGISINDPKKIYVYATRAAGSTQAIVGHTQLIWPTVATSIGDRRGAYNAATGVFTVPTGMAGKYRVKAKLYFSGTVFVAGNCYVEVLVNGASARLSLLSQYGTTILSGEAGEDFDLAAGDTVTIKATIDGATKNFGGASWPCSLMIECIA